MSLQVRVGKEPVLIGQGTGLAISSGANGSTIQILTTSGPDKPTRADISANGTSLAASGSGVFGTAAAPYVWGAVTTETWVQAVLTITSTDVKASGLPSRKKRTFFAAKARGAWYATQMGSGLTSNAFLGGTSRTRHKLSAEPAQAIRLVYRGSVSDGTNGVGEIPRVNSSGTISGATNASPIVITTAAAHNLQDGDAITIASVGGNTAANGSFFAKLTGYSTTTAGLYYDKALTQPVAGSGAYTSGGTFTAYRDVTVKASVLVPTGIKVTQSGAAGNATTITAAAGTFYSTDFAFLSTANFVALCTGGTAANLGKYRYISANTATTITVGAFPSNIADGDTFEIFELLPVHFNGVRTAQLGPEGLLFSDWIFSNHLASACLAGNRWLYVHTDMRGTAGVRLPLAQHQQTTFGFWEMTNMGDGGMTTAATGGPEQCDQGDISAGSGAGVVSGALATALTNSSAVSQCLPAPCAIIGMSARRSLPSVAIVGDSRSKDTANGPQYTSGSDITTSPLRRDDISPIGRFLTSIGVPYFVGARSAETLQSFISRSGQARAAICEAAADVRHIRFSTNDLGSNTNAGALDIIRDLETAIASAIADGAIPVVSTILPITTSSDNWETLANQTVGANETRRLAANAWIRANVEKRGGIVCDECAPLEDISTGLWNPAQKYLHSNGTTTGVITTVRADGSRFQDTTKDFSTDPYLCAGASAFFRFLSATNAKVAAGVKVLNAPSASDTYTFTVSYGVQIDIGDTYEIFFAMTTDGTHLTDYAANLLASYYETNVWPKILARWQAQFQG